MRTNRASKSLAQCIEPTLCLAEGIATLFNGLVSGSGEDILISIPEIAERMTPDIVDGDMPPELQTADLTAITDVISNDLPGTAAQRDPHRAFIVLESDKLPECIKFKHIIWSSRRQRVRQQWKMLHPVFEPARYGLTGKIEDASNAV